MVAERAGTSIATVSLVVNGKDRGRVSTPIADRVRDAVSELGYVVDHAASSLARGRGDLVVLVAPDLSNPFFAEVIRGVRDTIGDRFQLVASVTERGAQPTAADVRRFSALRPAGILVDAPAAGFLDELGTPDHPVVLLDAPGTEDRAVAVNYDLAPGVDALVEHLHAAGHRTVAYLDGTSRAETFALRRSLFRAAATRFGITVVDDDVRSDLGVDAAGAAVRDALDGWLTAGATAVVAAADTIAYGVLAVAHERGLRIPEDLAVAGFDDLPSSIVTAPALTSVALPGADLGREAARRLLDALAAPATPTTSGPDAARRLPARLVPRASTGA
jgi:LacI family transcriptional regulator